MQILNQNNNINFTSAPLYHVNLKKVSASKNLGKAILSNLNPKDDIDKEAVKQIKKYLIQNETFQNEHSVGKAFCDDFFGFFSRFSKFEAIELPNDNVLHKKIIGLVSYYKNISGNLHLSFIFTNPAFQSKNNTRNLKGVGEIALGRVFKMAQKIEAPELNFTSSKESNEFYFKTLKRAHINLNNGKNSFNEYNNQITINQEDFNKYLDYIKKNTTLIFRNKLKTLSHLVT